VASIAHRINPVVKTAKEIKIDTLNIFKQSFRRIHFLNLIWPSLISGSKGNTVHSPSGLGIYVYYQFSTFLDKLEVSQFLDLVRRRHLACHIFLSMLPRHLTMHFPFVVNLVYGVLMTIVFLVYITHQFTELIE
jgi:hypothetical protein